MSIVVPDGPGEDYQRPRLDVHMCLSVPQTPLLSTLSLPPVGKGHHGRAAEAYYTYDWTEACGRIDMASYTLTRVVFIGGQLVDREGRAFTTIISCLLYAL